MKRRKLWVVTSADATDTPEAKYPLPAAGPTHNRDVAKAIGIRSEQGYARLYDWMKSDECLIFREKTSPGHRIARIPSRRQSPRIGAGRRHRPAGRRRRVSRSSSSDDPGGDASGDGEHHRLARGSTRAVSRLANADVGHRVGQSISARQSPVYHVQIVGLAR